MTPGAPDLDDSMTTAMRVLSGTELLPTVRIANWLDVQRHHRWGPRWEHDPELCLVHAGRFRYRVIGEAWQVVPERSILLIPPAVRHELEPEPGCARWGLACWHGELLDDGATWADGGYGLAVEPRTITEIGSAPFVLSAFRRLAEAWQGYGQHREAMARDLVRLIWLHLLEAWSAAGDPAPTAHVAEMLAWVRANLDHQPGRAQIARAFGLTPQHVNALFRRGLGMTPGEVVRRERVLRAWHDLHAGGQSVNEAATRAGFNDPFHFSRVFRRVMGFPPSRAMPIRGGGRPRR
jgi:AraC-like DNA-binding protein